MIETQKIVVTATKIIFVVVFTGIYKFGNNTYPRRIRRRSNLGHIFREKSASYGPGNTVIAVYCRSYRKRTKYKVGKPVKLS